MYIHKPTFCIFKCKFRKKKIFFDKLKLRKERTLSLAPPHAPSHCRPTRIKEIEKKSSEERKKRDRKMKRAAASQGLSIMALLVNKYTTQVSNRNFCVTYFAHRNNKY